MRNEKIYDGPISSHDFNSFFYLFQVSWTQNQILHIILIEDRGSKYIEYFSFQIDFGNNCFG